MSRRRKGDHINGVVLLDKPPGFSSNQALQMVRRLFNARKGGHTGNLDPFATGMLPICLGEASKTAAFMLDAKKAYRAVACLGAATATGDPEGEVVAEKSVPELTIEQLKSNMASLTGAIEQVPPMFSALKVDGKPLYELARQGITVERKARPVTIYSMELLSWDAPLLTFEVVCSKGTYIRTLAEDLASSLGTLAHLRELRRLWVAPFAETQMVSLDALREAQQPARVSTATPSPASEELLQHMLPVDAGLQGWPRVPLTEADGVTFMHGNPVRVGHADALQSRPDQLVLVQDHQLRPLGIGLLEGEKLKPRRVFLLDQPGDL